MKVVKLDKNQLELVHVHFKSFENVFCWNHKTNAFNAETTNF